MKKLQDVYQKNGFIYTLIERNENKAMYKQENENGNIIGHEVFIIQIAKESEAFGTVFPERERFPSDNDFGVTAWSVGADVKRAYQKYVDLDIKISEQISKLKNNNNAASNR